MDEPVVRSPQNAAEWHEWYLLFRDVFRPGMDDRTFLDFYVPKVEGPESFDPGLCRGVWADGKVVARYSMFDRLLEVGPSRLGTLCIAGVATHPDYRLRHYGAAMMWDAVDLAGQYKRPLLLLAGIANFYYRFGFVPATANTAYHCARAAIDALPPAKTCAVRDAVPADAPALLQLYHAGYDGMVGCSTRELPEQELFVKLWPKDKAVAIAFGPNGEPRGCLNNRFVGWGAHVGELVALDSDALTALLKYHALKTAGGENPPAELGWTTPQGLLTAALLTDLVPVRCDSNSHPCAGWQARLGDVETFVDAMTPTWTQRWQGRKPFSFTLSIDDQLFGINCGDEVVRREPVGDLVKVSGRAMIKLLFGRRTPQVLLGRGVEAAPKGVAALSALFPPVPSGVPSTDDF